jgi:predicted GNAT family acetyltransferase
MRPRRIWMSRRDGGGPPARHTMQGVPDNVRHLEAMLRFMRRTTELSADEVRSIRSGWVVKTPSLAAAWGLNHLRLSGRMSFGEVLELTEKELGYLPYRHVVVEDKHAQRELEPAFTTAGWKADREVLMVLAREPDREIDTSAVVQLEDASLELLMTRWTLEDHPDTKPETMRQLLDFFARETHARGDRGFAILDENGSAAAMTKLRTEGKVAQVEDVYTVPEARGRGYARTLVTRAVEVAKADAPELIFIMADDDDWPKELYARIGFERAGRLLQFHKELPRS